MNSPLVRYRTAGSCIAGLFIGLSIVIAVFAVMEENSSDWLTILLFGALVFGVPIIFALDQASVRLSAQPKTRIERGTC
jgi:formate/nitrite transporter FocA (FNT family)